MRRRKPPFKMPALRNGSDIRFMGVGRPAVALNINAITPIVQYQHAWLDDMEAGLHGPIPTLMDQITAEISHVIGKGLACTVTAFGKALYTVHPDGSIEQHHDWESQRRPELNNPHQKA